MKILIMGLSGSGKTFLSKLLQKELSCAWYNADNLREMADDWDFSNEGRMRQSLRMKALADFETENGRLVICDFICPAKEAREIFKSLSDIKNPIAPFKLAWMYENAIGGEKNIYKASYFYKLAASRDQYNAYLYLANLSLTDPNNIDILLAASYSSIAKKKNVTGSHSLLNRLLPLLDSHELDEMAILISSLESEIEKIKLINS